MQTDFSRLPIALIVIGSLAGCASSGDSMSMDSADEPSGMAETVTEAIPMDEPKDSEIREGLNMEETVTEAIPMDEPKDSEIREGLNMEETAPESMDMTDAAMGAIGMDSDAGGGLTGMLVEQLGVSPTQASGGAGAIFNLARDNLSPDQFGRLSNAVPGMDSLLGAAPALGAAGALGGSGIPGLSGGGMGGLSAGTLGSLVGPFSDLGLSPDMIGRFVPVILEYLQGSGGSSAAGLLRGALF